MTTPLLVICLVFIACLIIIPFLGDITWPVMPWFTGILPIALGSIILFTVFVSNRLREGALFVLLSWILYFLCIYSSNISLFTSFPPLFFPVPFFLFTYLYINRWHKLSLLTLAFGVIQFIADFSSMSMATMPMFYQGLFMLLGALGGLLLVEALHIDTLVWKCISDIEYRRQTAHALFGLLLGYFIYIGVLSSLSLFIVLLLGGLLVLLVKQGRLSPLAKVLLIFERPHHFERFPGRGIFYYVCGAFLVSLYASPGITAGSILILALGDSVTNVVGKDLGRYPIPYNPKKNIEGPLAGALIAALVCALVVPLHIALITSVIAMFVETLPLNIKGFEIDDNISIPVSASLILMLLL